MAKTTLTYMEAREQFPILTQNRYEMLENSNDFPSLPNSFTEITSGTYRTRNEQQYRPHKPKRPIEEVNIADQVQIFSEKKKKTDGEQNGVALFNTFRVTDFERWAQKFEEQRKKQLQRQCGAAQGMPEFNDDQEASGATSSQASLTAISRRTQIGNGRDFDRTKSADGVNM